MYKKKIIISSLPFGLLIILLAACSPAASDNADANNGRAQRNLEVCNPSGSRGDPPTGERSIALSFPTAISIADFAAVGATKPTAGANEPIVHDGGDVKNFEVSRRDDRFGFAIANLGDLSGDGTIEVAVGAPIDVGESPGGVGSVYIYSLAANGSVVPESAQKIAHNTGGLCFCGTKNGEFGAAIAPIGDRDGDSITDLAVGSPGFELPTRNFRCGIRGENLQNSGAVYILYMNSDGTVKSDPVILTEGLNSDVFPEQYADVGRQSAFGSAVVDIGDLDGDMINELAVGASGYDCTNVVDGGAVLILFMDEDEHVKRVVHIGRPVINECTDTPNLTALKSADRFGAALAYLGDPDGSGPIAAAIAVGAPGFDRVPGYVQILFLDATGTLMSSQRITNASAGLSIANGARFGASLATLGDVDGDGIVDIAVGAPEGSSSSNERDGTVYLLALNRNGTAKSIIRTIAAGDRTAPDGNDALAAARAIDSDCGVRTAEPSDNDNFGSAVAYLGDLNGITGPDLAIGASGWRDLRVFRQASNIISCDYAKTGAFWVLQSE